MTYEERVAHSQELVTDLIESATVLQFNAEELKSLQFIRHVLQDLTPAPPVST